MSTGGPLTTPLLRPLLLAATTLCALGATSGALAAQASAAAIVPNRPCYVNTNSFQGAPMTITGSGFTPGDSVTVSGGTALAFSTVGADGSFATTTQAPTLPTVDPATQATTLTATDDDGVTAATTVMSANLAVSATPGSVRHPARTKVTFKFSGFTPGRHIDAYYLHHNKPVAKVKFGKASGPCGTSRQKALMYPGGHPRYDEYKVAFESSSRYSKKAFPEAVDELSVFAF